MSQNQEFLLPTIASYYIRPCPVCKTCKAVPCHQCEKSVVGQHSQVAYHYFPNPSAEKSNGWSINTVYLCDNCKTTHACVPMEKTVLNAIFNQHHALIIEKEKPSMLAVAINASAEFNLYRKHYFKIASKLASHVCKNCGNKEKTLRCSGCLFTRYCSEACSKADWKRHKSECKLIQTSNFFLEPIFIVK